MNVTLTLKEPDEHAKEVFKYAHIRSIETMTAQGNTGSERFLCIVNHEGKKAFFRANDVKKLHVSGI